MLRPCRSVSAVSGFAEPKEKAAEKNWTDLNTVKKLTREVKKEGRGSAIEPFQGAFRKSANFVESKAFRRTCHLHDVKNV